ncbi:MAG: ribonuclease H-like domain-containing protein [bacterium]|nr:ribonuclease H-like domain-containing protein [bacterium]
MSKKWSVEEKLELHNLYLEHGPKWSEFANQFNVTPNAARKCFNQTDWEKLLSNKDRNDSPKILAIDFETTPLKAYTWGPKYETNLLDIFEHTQILSFSCKWIGGQQITRGWMDYRGYKPGVENERPLIDDLVKLINQAHIIIGHNCKQFDLKILNARLAFYKIPPLSPLKVVDTKTEAKKYFRLPSYSLDDLCNFFGIPRKLHHEGFPMWLGCKAGNKKDWQKMLEYNGHDVKIQEILYLRLRPFMKSHPNIGIFKDGLVCPNCGEDQLKWEGWYRNKTTKYHAFSCKKCGAWGRDTKNVQKIKPLIAT